MLISVHLPKTAGESFFLSLQSVYGENIQRDYSDGPLQKSKLDRNMEALQAAIANVDNEFDGIDCIHGHFMPVKYLILESYWDVQFITWLRNPIDRAISHYFYWKNNYDKKNAGPLQRKMIDEDWDLVRFVFCAELQNFYVQYLWGFPIERFDFIGITERYGKELAYLSEHIIQENLVIHKVNIGKKPNYDITPDLRKEMEKFHCADMELYQKILKKKSKRNWGNNLFFGKKR